MEYLFIEIILFVIFYLIQRHYKVKIFRHKKQFIVFWILIFLFGVSWDRYAVIRGHWLYPGKGILNIFVGQIPIEDYIFMILVPYGILVAYQISNKFLEEREAKK